MNAILLVLRTGCQWKALKVTGLCSGSSAHRRFQEWVEAGVFQEFWRRGLLVYDELVGIDWSWVSMDGAMTKAPLGGEKTGPNPTDRAKKGTKRSLLTDAAGIPIGVAVDGANRNDHKMAVPTGVRDPPNHRNHRGPGDHPVISRQFFARADNAARAQGESARGGGAEMKSPR
jgi:putative transposase